MTESSSEWETKKKVVYSLDRSKNRSKFRYDKIKQQTAQCFIITNYHHLHTNATTYIRMVFCIEKQQNEFQFCKIERQRLHYYMRINHSWSWLCVQCTSLEKGRVRVLLFRASIEINLNIYMNRLDSSHPLLLVKVCGSEAFYELQFNRTCGHH